MKIQGIEVNAEAIGAGLLRMVDDLGDSYPAALRLGMLPAPLMQLLERTLGEKFEEIARNEANKLMRAMFGPDAELVKGSVADDAKKKAFVREASHQVALAMYAGADLVV